MHKIGLPVDLDAYALGWVDGAARRPLTGQADPGEVRYTSADLGAAFDLGRRVGREVDSRRPTGVDAEVIAAAARLNSRLQNCEPEIQPVRHGHLRVIR
jgi:hypothetical protein